MSNNIKEAEALLMKGNSIIDSLLVQNERLKKKHSSLDVFEILIKRYQNMPITTSNIIDYAELSVKVAEILNKPAS